jgi:putative OPT family oligopeptide transporter
MIDSSAGATAASRPAEPELTLRGIALGIAITLLFTAANVYLGLKVGLTFASSIPAAVISMAILRFVKGASILENNIVQTLASAAGTLAGVIFVVPGLVMVGWWSGFPFWQTFAICACGGMLGVMFSIPLRRALVTGSDLPYPEGVAAAEVLKVGVGSREGAIEGREGLRVLVFGSLAAAGYGLLSAAKLATAEIGIWFRLGGAASGTTIGLAFALVGAGHLCGLSVGVAIFLGLVIGFFVATPILTWLHHTPGAAADAAQGVWGHEVRFIGAGVIGVAALWATLRLVMPIIEGLRSAAAASRARRAGQEVLPIEERDIPVGIMGLVIAALLVPMAVLLHGFLAGGTLVHIEVPLILGALLAVLVISAFVAAVCGYMAGLIGASNSPISGVGILAMLASALLLALFAAPYAGPGGTKPLIAFALFITSIVLAAACIANDNLQDLKTGQLVGATPWRQQVALMIGVVAGAVAIPPVLSLLNKAYGFAGAPGVDPAHALPAPQAVLISALAKGVIAGGLDWSLIGIGAALGAVLIAFDGLLGRMGWLRMPTLAVGLGIYLPGASTVAVTVGAVLGWLYDRRHRGDEAAQRMGVLLASGFIVGDGLFGVLNAGLIVGFGADPLAIVGDSFAPWANGLGLLLFAGMLVVLYRWIGGVLKRGV